MQRRYMLFILLLQLCTVWLGKSQGKTLMGDDAISWDEERDVSSDEKMPPVFFRNNGPYSYYGKREASPHMPPAFNKFPGYDQYQGKRK